VDLLPLSSAAMAARAASPAMRSSHAASLTTASCCRACAQGKKDERYCFVVDWFDPQASLVRKYQLIYYSADGTIEMYDLKNRRTFLKRCDYPAVTLKDLYKGGVITVYSRQLTIVEYGDGFTAGKLEKASAAVCVTIAPGALPQMGRIIDAITSSSLVITELRLLAEGLVLKLVGEDGPAVWSSLKPQIDGALGKDSVTQSGDVFAAGLPKTVVSDGATSTLLLVRPHAIKAGLLGRIIDQALGSGFELLNAAMLQLTRPNAAEFLEVYKGVVPECVDWIEELTQGKIVALQLRFASQPTSSVLKLRELCGAHDPEVARHLHTQSLRALYGESKIRNAVHCTDLPEDGALEVDYFFSILGGQSA